MFVHIADCCLAYLQREEEFLTRVLEVTEDMRESLLSRNDNEIMKLMDRYELISGDAEGLSKSRRDIRKRMVQELEVAPEEATVTLLLQHCDRHNKNALAAVQNRVHELGNKLNVLLSANSNLALQMLEVLNRRLSGPRR